MEAKLSHHKIIPVRQLSEDVPSIMLDSDKLKQVLMNLILNAIQSMPNGGKLTIATKFFVEQGQKDSKILIEVSDTGVGIPPENLSRLFVPFFTTKDEGTGLGLTNARRIIQQHGGDIEVRSKVEFGTTVIVSLPVAYG